MTKHLEVVPEFQDTFERPAWWFKEQWLRSRPVQSPSLKPIDEEFRKWAYAREGIPYPESTPPLVEPAAAPPAPTSKPMKSTKAASTYLLGIDGSPLVKIGHTTASPKSRMASLQTGLPMQLSLLWSCEGDFESDLHVHFAAYRVRGEWFDLTPLGDPVDAVKAAVAEIEVSRV
ncbi:GIY-YIG nuclease family protein [Streptomyces luteogriseus]|uniref:GIY-YIG nuclease family protein n=1 Tax=Streptomyces luteogriseus TaxID=68233 RepID=UPI003801826A